MIAVRRPDRRGLDHVAEARRRLDEVTRCPGTGTPVGDRDLVIDSQAMCPTCREPVQVEWVAQARQLAAHHRPEVQL